VRDGLCVVLTPLGLLGEARWLSRDEFVGLLGAGLRDVSLLAGIGSNEEVLERRRIELGGILGK